MRAEELFGQGTEKRMDQATAMIAKECERSCRKLLCFTLLERGLMLEVQVTVFAISRHILKYPKWAIPWYLQFDGMMMFSVFTSLACFLKASYDHIDRGTKLWGCLTSFERSENLSPASQRSLSKARRVISAFKLGFIFCILVLLHCLAKIFGALSCESAMWNFPRSTPSVSIFGCVSPDMFT